MLLEEFYTLSEGAFISFKSFQRALSDYHQQAIEMVFDSMDTDQNDSIDIREFKTFQKRLSVCLIFFSKKMETETRSFCSFRRRNNVSEKFWVGNEKI